jgi:hypothetical protein
MKSSDMKFEYPDDREYFEDLFSEVGGLTQNSVHFDFRDPDEKRREFNRIRNRIFEELESMHGSDCQLKCHFECEGVSTQVDHLTGLPVPTKICLTKPFDYTTSTHLITVFVYNLHQPPDTGGSQCPAKP